MGKLTLMTILLAGLVTVGCKREEPAAPVTPPPATPTTVEPGLPQQTGEAAEEMRRETEEAGREIQEEAREAGEEIQEEAQEAGEELEQGAQDLSEMLRQGAREAEESIEQGTREAGEELEELGEGLQGSTLPQDTTTPTPLPPVITEGDLPGEGEMDFDDFTVPGPTPEEIAQAQITPEQKTQARQVLAQLQVVVNELAKVQDEASIQAAEPRINAALDEAERVGKQMGQLTPAQEAKLSQELQAELQPVMMGFMQQMGRLSQMEGGAALVDRIGQRMEAMDSAGEEGAAETPATDPPATEPADME